jgi:hypothetical protein
MKFNENQNFLSKNELFSTQYFTLLIQNNSPLISPFKL